MSDSTEDNSLLGPQQSLHTGEAGTNTANSSTSELPLRLPVETRNQAEADLAAHILPETKQEVSLPWILSDLHKAFYPASIGLCDIKTSNLW
jgi:hypothetical protein